MSSNHIEALKALRSMSVGVRRRCVAEFLQFEGACGNEKRLIEIQDAIAAIDAALADEYRLLETREQITLPGGIGKRPQPTDGFSNGSGRAREAAGGDHKQAANGNDSVGPIARSNGWRSYRDWLASDRSRLAS